jgi:hypothetical protein
MSIKASLPYVFRYELANSKRWRDGHPDYNERTLTVADDNMGAVALIASIAEQLPGWQATSFPSHIILYKEDRKYKYGRVIWPV